MLIKDAGEVICEPLAMIFNSSLRHGIFPDIWKLARVTPIFRSGSRSDANNYGPMSVISVFSRILESIVHDQMYDYLRSRGILTISQSCGKELGQRIIAFTHPRRPLFWIGRSDHFQQISCNFHPLSKKFISL